jgi:hypothetical protein
MSIGMNSDPTHSTEACRHERAISAITEGDSTSLENIRGLYTEEFAWLEKGAKIRT